MSGSDVAAIAAAPASQDVRKRWLLLAAALVVGLVAAFVIGSAVKKSSAPAVAPGTLAPAASASSQHASITALASSGAVPTLHAAPKKPKPKTSTTSQSSNTGTSSPSTGSSVSSSSVSSTPVQSTTPVVSNPTPSTSSSGGGGGGASTSSGGGSTSSGGVSHGGGGG